MAKVDFRHPHLRGLANDVTVTSHGSAILDVIIEHNDVESSKCGLEVSIVTVHSGPVPVVTVLSVFSQGKFGKYLVKKLCVNSCVQTAGQIFMRAQNDMMPVDIEPICFRIIPNTGCTPTGWF